MGTKRQALTTSQQVTYRTAQSFCTCHKP
jgi:hypothetical protein